MLLRDFLWSNLRFLLPPTPSPAYWDTHTVVYLDNSSLLSDPQLKRCLLGEVFFVPLYFYTDRIAVLSTGHGGRRWWSPSLFPLFLRSWRAGPYFALYLCSNTDQSLECTTAGKHVALVAEQSKLHHFPCNVTWDNFLNSIYQYRAPRIIWGKE